MHLAWRKPSISPSRFSCPQPGQSGSEASPTEALSMVVVPTASNPNTYSQPQFTLGFAITVNQTGTPCVSEPAHAETATHKDPLPNQWLSCSARPTGKNLGAPCGGIAAISPTISTQVSTSVVEIYNRHVDQTKNC